MKYFNFFLVKNIFELLNLENGAENSIQNFIICLFINRKIQAK